MLPENKIPQSDQLSIPQVESLSELLSRDPETYTENDLEKIIKEYREQRKRWDSVQESKAKTPSKTAPGKPNALLQTSISMEDI